MNLLLAVRTVSETDDVHEIEGLAYPFRGRDTYGTFFSARTDYHWDLFPDVVPATDPAARSDGTPSYVRPLTFHHGFDADFGLERIGGWSPVRMDADGVWVRAQIDKRKAYYATRIQPLLAAGALGMSGGSAEHSVRIDQRSGEVLEWPAYELALTPVESNPLAQLATRAGETVTIIDGREEPTEPSSAKPTAVRYSPAAWDASAAAYVLGSLLDLLGGEGAETEQATMLRDAIANVQAFITAESAEIGQDGDTDPPSVVESLTVTAYAAGTRSERNPGQALHDHAITLGASCPAAGRADGDPADAQPTVIVVRSDAPDPLEEVRAGLAARAAEVAAEVVRSRTG